MKENNLIKKFNSVKIWERIVYFFIFILLVVCFINYHDNKIEYSNIYSFIFINVIGFFAGVACSFKIVLKGWEAIFGVIVFLLLGLFVSGMVFVAPKQYSEMATMLLGLLSTFSIAVAAAAFTNYKK
ncbi:MAG: hypothetical protein AB7U71_01665 [Comamonas sp.]